QKRTFVLFCALPLPCTVGPSSARRRPETNVRSLYEPSLVDAEQLDVEVELGVGRNDPTRAARAIAERRRDDQASFAPHLHRHHPLVPAGDHLPDADDELERLPAVARAVELLAVRERAGVVHRHPLALLRRGALAYLVVDILQPRRSLHRIVAHG